MSSHEDEFTCGPMSGAEGKLETIHRLCRILYLVHEKRIGFDEGACDCICPERSKDSNGWRSTGQALAWLEKLVDALPKGNVTVDITERFHMGPDGKCDYHDVVVAPVRVPPIGTPSDSGNAQTGESK